jgi:DNA-binding beta-propeller fold protein YncE
MRCKNILAIAMLAALAPTATAQVVGIALDPKAVMVEGEMQIVDSPPADSVVFFEFTGSHAKRLGQVQAPTSFQGPPSSVAITTDRKLALVSASLRIDPNNPNELAPDNKLTVVDLAASPIRVVQTIELGASPSSVAIDPTGTLALAVHNTDDSVTLLALTGGHAKVVEKVSLGKGAGPLAAAFAPNGKQLLISFPDRGRIGVFAVENGRLNIPAIREMSAGIYPTALSYCGRSGLAVVSNYGKVTGDIDTVSLLDVGAATPRVVDTVSVGPAPEGIACSPDGQYAAASLQNMSTLPRTNPFHSTSSKVVLLKIENKRLRRIAEAPFGAWAQGIGFLDDSRTLFSQSMVDRSLHLFRIEGEDLKVVAPPIVFKDGAPVSYGISGR